MHILSVCHTISAVAPVPDTALELSNVCKVYQGKTVVDHLSLSVNSGEIFGLVGPNGAGKTTLMKMIAGLSRPASGTVRIFGRDGIREHAAIKPLLGWVPQDNNLERELTVREVLVIYARLYAVPQAKSRVQQVIDEFGLESFSDKEIGFLSGGMARRVLIARAMLPEPAMLLLDEPTVGLDPDVRQDIWLLIRRLAGEEKTIFMTTHYMDEAEQLCDRLALLKAGKIVITGTPVMFKQLADEAGDREITLEKAFLRLIRREA